MDNSNKMYLVKNRSAGQVCYSIPDLVIKKHLAPGETIKVSFDELEKLSNQPGGRQLMVNFLQIEEEEVLNNLDIKVQPEYYMNEKQIVELLTKGSLDAFLDCLDYAPTGVIDLVKDIAIKLPLADYDKKDALRQKTGFDVDKALLNKRAEEEEARNPGGFVADNREKATASRPTGRRTNVTYKTNNVKTSASGRPKPVTTK